MKILIVGGAGYIGSHVAKWLSKNNIETIILDNFTRGNKNSVKWSFLYNGDCASRELLDKIFSEHTIDAVMHFAAFAYVGESVLKPNIYYGNNVASTISLLDALVAHRINKFIFSSTCATFGEALTVPIDESHPQNPINPYGRSKLMVEWILRDYERAYGLKSCIFRYFNAAGCDPDGEIGETHNPETHLIPLVLKSLLNNDKVISVFGTDYSTKDGTCIRDYIHVNDIAEAHRLGLLYLLKNNQSDAFNLGNGQGFSVWDVIKTAEKITGRKARIVEKPRRAGDPPILIGSSTKAKDVLGWEPLYTELGTIIETAWKWEINSSSRK